MQAVDCFEWYVVRTKPKRERLASQSIRSSLGLEVCCPQVRYRKSTRRGRVWWVEAMFPGYIFVRFNQGEHSRAVRAAQGVLAILQFGGVIPALDPSFVSRLQADVGSDEQLVIHHGVHAGDSVEVAQGAMSGESGVVVEVLPAVERVRLLVEFLGEEREVEFDIADLLLSGRPDM